MVEDTNFEDDQLASMTTDDIVRASRLLDNEIRILKVPPLFLNLAFGSSYTASILSIRVYLGLSAFSLSDLVPFEDVYISEDFSIFQEFIFLCCYFWFLSLVLSVFKLLLV